MKRNIVISLFLSAMTLAACSRQENVFKVIPLMGGVSEEIVSFVILDTLYIDSSATSLRGEWDIHGDRLFFSDHSLCSIREYDPDGSFIGKHIGKGRGPGESPSPFNVVCFYPDGRVCVQDQSWHYTVFDSSMTKTLYSYTFLSDKGYRQSDWMQLLKKPDPEIDNMYEFNLDSPDMEAFGDQILVPVYTEHVTMNAYSRINSSKFWKQSYNFMLIDPEAGRITAKFGHFPLAYHRQRIPAFYTYSFDVDDDLVYVGYAADTLIYAMDAKGTIVGAFGSAFEGFDGRFPENKSFDDYSLKLKDFRADCAYFEHLYADSPWIFRSYKMPGDSGYGLQLYKDYDLAADIPFNESVRVIGCIGDCYYLEAPPDIDDDRFVIYRMKII